MWLLIACTDAPVESGEFDSVPECELGAEICDERGVCWVSFCSGAFQMGTDRPQWPLEGPAHGVEIPEFELSRSEMTAAQHRRCVDDGACRMWADEPQEGRCNQTDMTRRLPANCLDWDMAVELCAWAGGRLPSEAEWEYAATSAGLDNPFPWGEAHPTCDRATYWKQGCGQRTEPVCSTPAGNTEQGLCDVAGNVFEWVEDYMHDGYIGAPSDGSAWVVGGSQEFRVMRGGGIGSSEDLRTRNRTFHEPDFYYTGLGVRCAR